MFQYTIIQHSNFLSLGFVVCNKGILHYVFCSFGLVYVYGIPYGNNLFKWDGFFKTQIINGAILLHRIDLK